MQRDLDALTGRRFDVLVVGGGISGLFAAYEAASLGWSTALVDAGDFGSGATFNHQRTLHGGLRALQTGNLAKARRQIAERRTWAIIAPHLVRPLPFLVGTYRFTRRSRLTTRIGFKLYDLIGRRRNAGVLPELHLPRTRLESRAATKALFHGIDQTGLSGGAAWQDLKMGVGHLSRWKRIALVTDVEWMANLTSLFGWMTPGELKQFPMAERDAAIAWAAADD